MAFTFALLHEQISALAPDPASLIAGQRLATVASWQTVGRSDTTVWGECQGSASKPYRAQIVLQNEVFQSRCSCPSRKTPCKHVLGVLLLFANEPAIFEIQEPPDWIIAQDTHEAADETPLLPTARSISTQRAMAREQRVADGIAELQRWLDDLLRQGFAAAQQQPSSFWEQAAARLMDAQAPGLARLMRALPGVAASGTGWPERMLERIARIHLLLEGYARLANLPETTKADLRTAIGWNFSREEIAERAGVADQWQIIGRRVSEDEGLRTQRTYLYGQRTQQFALELEFVAAHQALDRALVPGTAIDGELAFYPSAAPLRALVKTQHGAAQRMHTLSGQPIVHGLTAFAEAVARNPWIEQYPLLIAGAVPVRGQHGWHIQADEQVLPLVLRAERGWQLLALSGGHPITMFGEWNGETLLPLGAWAEGVFSDLG